MCNFVLITRQVKSSRIPQVTLPCQQGCVPSVWTVIAWKVMEILPVQKTDRRVCAVFLRWMNQTWLPNSERSCRRNLPQNLQMCSHSIHMNWHLQIWYNMLYIHTSDNPPFHQPVRRTPFALHQWWMSSLERCWHKESLSLLAAHELIP